MAELPEAELTITGGCPDCGRRTVALPQPLPAIRDDFDWSARDYDGFRRFMLEEFAARFSERSRWTPADMEVILIEAFSAVLDQYSDMLDRVTADAYLETARRPASVRRLLSLIGFDALAEASRSNVDAEKSAATDGPSLDAYWLANPSAMEAARREGPRRIHTQNRMVTRNDYAERLEDHPLVERVEANVVWSGSWTSIELAVIAVNNRDLDSAIGKLNAETAAAILRFHDERRAPLDGLPPEMTLRALLQPVVESGRMLGQEVVLIDAIPVPISLSLSVRVAGNFFQSEVRRAVEEALGRGSTGFFRPGRLRFGEDLHASDLLQTLTALDGVTSVCINRFKRLAPQFADMASVGTIVLEGREVAICDNDSARPSRGGYRLTLHGGQPG